MANKYLDSTGVKHLWDKIKNTYQLKGNCVTVDTTQTISGTKTYTGNNIFKNNYFEIKASSANDDSWIKLTNATDSGYYAFGIRRPYATYGLQMKYHPASGNDVYYNIWHAGNFTPSNYLTTSAASNTYLPKSGGVMTGMITFGSNVAGFNREEENDDGGTTEHTIYIPYSGGTMALTSDIPSVVNNLTSTAADKPLSANQGKVLNDKIAAIIDGSQYVQNAIDADSAVYATEAGSVAWANVTGKTNATGSTAGLMSATDKSNLDTIVNSFNSDDADTTIETVKEVLKVFESYPAGTSLANALAGKLDKSGGTISGTLHVSDILSASSVTADDIEVSGGSLTISGVSASAISSGGGTLATENWVNSKEYLTTSAASSTYLPLSGGTLTGLLKTAENTMGLKLRTHASYETGWVYGTSGNEAITLAMQNPVTAFQIVYGTKPSAFAGGTWQSVTPLFQTKDGKVIINRKITATSETTNLKLFDVNGDANATTLYENGIALSSKYQAKGDYLPLSGGTITGALGIEDANLNFGDYGYGINFVGGSSVTENTDDTLVLGSASRPIWENSGTGEKKQLATLDENGNLVFDGYNKGIVFSAYEDIPAIYLDESDDTIAFYINPKFDYGTFKYSLSVGDSSNVATRLFSNYISKWINETGDEYTYNFPNKSGTIALLEDISSGGGNSSFDENGNLVFDRYGQGIVFSFLDDVPIIDMGEDDTLQINSGVRFYDAWRSIYISELGVSKDIPLMTAPTPISYEVYLSVGDDFSCSIKNNLYGKDIFYITPVGGEFQENVQLDLTFLGSFGETGTSYFGDYGGKTSVFLSGGGTRVEIIQLPSDKLINNYDCIVCLITIYGEGYGTAPTYRVYSKRSVVDVGTFKIEYPDNQTSTEFEIFHTRQYA